MKTPMTKTSSRSTPYVLLPPRRSASDLPTSRSPARTKRGNRPRLQPLDFSSVRKGATAEVAAITSSGADPGFSTPPSLRRASTLTLSDESSASSSKRISSKKSASLVVEDGTLSSSLKRLSSGSIVGNTSLSKSSSGRELSSDKSRSFKKSSSNVSTLLKSMTIPKRLSSCRSGSKWSTRAENVDENSLVTALEELKRIESSAKVESETEKETTKTKDTSKVSVSKESSKTSIARIGSRKKTNSVKSHGASSEEKMDFADDSETNSRFSTGAAEKAKGRTRSLSKCKSSEASEDKPVDLSVESSTGTSDDTRMNDYETPRADAIVPPPSELVEVAISFDTTGSMYNCLEEVRAKIQDLVQRLQADIPGIKFAVIAHGDYCDVDKYVIKWVDFGASLPELCEFVKGVEDTYGGDGPECYELVLLRTRETLSWTPGSRRALIMINDDKPHEPGYSYGGKKYFINWREECAKLRDMGVAVYGVQSGNDAGSTKFNREMTRMTGGKHLSLSQFSSIFDFIMMICYKEGNPDMLPVYEQEVRARDKRGIADDVATIAKTLGKDALPEKHTEAKRASKRRPVKKAGVISDKALTPPVVSKGKTKDRKATLKVGKPGKEKATRAKRGLKEDTVLKRKKGGNRDKIIKREKVPDSYMGKGKRMQNWNWSRWARAIVPVKPKSKHKFVTCSNYPGFRLKNIFRRDSRKPALYEFAVQCPGTSKKHVVYFRKSIGYKTLRFWDLYQFRHESIQKEVEQAISAGCTIWIRRGILHGNRSQKQEEDHVMESGVHIKTRIDYAWKKYLWRKNGNRMFHREIKVKRKGSGLLVISHSNL